MNALRYGHSPYFQTARQIHAETFREEVARAVVIERRRTAALAARLVAAGVIIRGDQIVRADR